MDDPTGRAPDATDTFPTVEAWAAAARRIWWLTVVQGVIALLFGVLALAFPVRTAAVLTLLVGVYALVDGAVDILVAIARRRTSPAGLRIVLGVVSVLFGVTLLAWPGLSLAFLVWTLAAWAVVAGVLQVVDSIRSRTRGQGARWAWGAARGALWVLLGIVVAAAPGSGLVVLMITVGIWALLAGAVLIVIGVQLRKAPAAG